MTWRKGVRVVALLCCLLLFANIVAPGVYAETPAERYERLKGELADINNQIDSYQNSMANAIALREALEEQKALVDEMIAIKQQEIAETEALLEQKENELAQSREIIYENEQLFRQRLVAIYKLNDANVLSSLLNVDSFDELLVVADAMRRITLHDTNLLNLLEEQYATLEAEQAEVDAMLADLQEAYAELEANAEVLAGNIAAQNSQISAAQAQIQAQKAAYNDTYAALVAAQQEMNQISSGLGGSTSSDGSEYVGGQLGWPVPGFYSISCYFGSPDPNGAPHRGMDIRGNGINGATIVAAGPGQVVTAGNAGNSYGNYVVIDHGGGIKTLYAHCSSVWVGAGQWVEQGAGIAAVGATGFVTGYHLHFEVLLNNSPQNPLSYVK